MRHPPPHPCPGRLRKVSGLSCLLKCLPTLRNAWPTVATELNHTSHQGNFRSQHRFLYICLTVDSVEKFLFTSNLEKKIRIKLPPKILAKCLKTSGIQSFFEVRNGCDLYFSPTSISGKAEDHRCLMLYSRGGPSWD